MQARRPTFRVGADQFVGVARPSPCMTMAFTWNHQPGTLLLPIAIFDKLANSARIGFARSHRSSQDGSSETSVAHEMPSDVFGASVYGVRGTQPGVGVVAP